MVYTLFFSSPLFIVVVVMTGGLRRLGGSLLRVLMGMALMVKTPLFFLHV